MDNGGKLNTMKCEQITLHLNNYLDGVLNREMAAECERHLLVCRECQELKEQILTVQSKYRINVMGPFLTPAHLPHN